METVKVSLVCDKEACVCSAWETESLKCIYGRVTYHVGYEIVEKQLQLSVPADLDQTLGIMCALHKAAKRIALIEGASHGEVYFRQDGSDKSLSLRELAKDFRYVLTGRGAPVMRRLYF